MLKNLIYEDVPCWYELSWDPDTPGILLRVHNHFLADCGPISGNSPYVVNLTDNFGFTSFSGQFNEDFGFDKALTLRETGSTEEFWEFFAKLPVIQSKDSDCQSCAGTGRDEYLDTPCILCGGRGIIVNSDWKSIYAISASFNTFFWHASFYEGETNSPLSQILTLRLVTKRNQQGGSLRGEFSRFLCQWLRKKESKTPISEMVKAMYEAYCHIFPLRPSDLFKYDFRATVTCENGGVSAYCPGEATGLYPSHPGPWIGEGCEFVSHNVDGPHQQMTLLAGLAALHDLVRQETG